MDKKQYVEPEIKEQKTAIGTVVNCEHLYVRKGPSVDNEHITIIDKGCEVKIDLEKSNKSFYKITTEAGVDGFAKSDFVNIK